MRPKRVAILRSFISRGLWLLAAILYALNIFPANAASSAEPQASSPPEANVVYDPLSFVEELSRLKFVLESARQSTGGLRAFRESLPSAWNVAAKDRQFTIPTDLLVTQLVKAERQPEIRAQKIKQALDYLDALASETASLSAHPNEPADFARSKLNSILSRPEYAHAIKESWWDNLRARFNEWLAEAFDRIFSNVISQASLGYILLLTVDLRRGRFYRVHNFSTLGKRRESGRNGLTGRGHSGALLAGVGLCGSRIRGALGLPHGDSLRILGGNRAPSRTRRAFRGPRQDSP